MKNSIKNTLSKLMKSRGFVLVLVLLILAFILIHRLFDLQIINGESYLTDFTMQIERTNEIKSTRGIIYDRNGYPLAYNELAYSVTFADNGTYDSTEEQNLTLNGSMYGILQILEKNGDDISTSSFSIALGDDGNYYFTTSGFNLERFKADIYGRALIDDMTSEEQNATANQMIQDMCSADMYGILGEYSEEELSSHGLPSSLTQEEILTLAIMRSKVAANSYQRYKTATLATGVSEQTMAEIMENKDLYPGVDIKEDSIRVYNDSVYFSTLLGYTGTISAEEMAALNQEGGDYDNTDIVGKAGLEQYFESELQGQKGSENVYVDNLGKVLSTDSRVDPVAGNDIYLTIDRDLTIAAYDILEQYIAAIVYQNTVDAREVDNENSESADEIRIAIYDVYYALFENNVLDVSHLSADDATALEQQVYQSFLGKQQAVFDEIRSELTSDNPTIYSELSDEMKAYCSYIVNDLLSETTGILNTDLIDSNDEVYQAWRTEESISLKEFLTHAISQDWIDVSRLNVEADYLASNEIYNALADYIAEYLKTDDGFSRQIYKYMIQEGQLSGRDVCLLLFDQGILEYNEEEYNQLSSGSISAYDFIRSKILNLEITPAQLALEPCTGSVVITDPNTGDVLACVSYPGYDNNRLSNEMDTEYFLKLNSDGSSPFYNKATQEETAPGSTFKLVTATAGLMEGVIDPYSTTYNCTGIYEETVQPIRCHVYPGNHGVETLETAIRDSCNFFFNAVGTSLKMQADGTMGDDNYGLERLLKYAYLYGFDSTTGIEIGETDPHPATSDVERTIMGQSDNAYTTTQLARYVSTVANSGTCYDLTLLSRITDSEGNLLEEQTPTVHSTVDMSDEYWNVIQSGMHQVTVSSSSSVFYDLSQNQNFQVAGKTGTAQQSTTHANHGLFVGYAPYEDPEIAMAVRITNGYNSRNATLVAKDIIRYYFDLADENELITGYAPIDLVPSGSETLD